MKIRIKQSYNTNIKSRRVVVNQLPVVSELVGKPFGFYDYVTGDSLLIERAVDISQACKTTADRKILVFSTDSYGRVVGTIEVKPWEEILKAHGGNCGGIYFGSVAKIKPRSGSFRDLAVKIGIAPQRLFSLIALNS